ncbi:MAG: hypothetical protein JW888_06970 [Pirellulales bacterium]|nr:hypothetical protein [Pirellulales bacterium]
MARENQGLHAALIVFVVLTIMLAVSTFVFFSQYNDASERAAKNQQTADEMKQRANDKDDIIKALRQIIGLAPNEANGPEDIQTAFDAEIQAYAANFPDDIPRDYRHVLQRQAEVIESKSESYLNEVEKVKQNAIELDTIRKLTAAEIAKYKAASEAAENDKQRELDEFVKSRQALEQSRDRLRDERIQADNDHKKDLKEKDDAITELQEKLLAMTDGYMKAKRTVDNMRRETPDHFQGEVCWVEPRGDMVWIPLGSADALRPQTQFSVFSAGTNNVAEASKKASIEVTRIRGSHLAEARIVDDTLTDPILVGDKIYTPIWSLGEKRHVALAGLIDLDNDGRSDLEQVHTLIEMNGGVVDARMDAHGKRTGSLNMDTRYLILGKDFEHNAPPELQADLNQIKNQAEQLRVETITLKNFLERMGWVRLVEVANFGVGGREEFPVKRVTKPPTAEGRISELFKPRNPPRTSGGSPY